MFWGLCQHISSYVNYYDIFDVMWYVLEEHQMICGLHKAAMSLCMNVHGSINFQSKQQVKSHKQ